MKHTASPSATHRTILLNAFHPDAMSQTLQSSRLEHVQLSDGRFRGRLLHLTRDERRLDYGEYNLDILARGSLAPTRITVGVLLESPSESSFNGAIARQGAMPVWTEGMELHTHLAKGCKWVCLQLEREVLAAAGIELPQTVSATLVLDRETSSNLVSRLASTLQLIGEVNAGRARREVVTFALSSIEDEMTSALRRGLASGEMRSNLGQSRAVSILNRAEGYIDAHLTEPISINQICAAVGVPLHTLERLFVRNHGVTPKQFLTYRRLTALRARLLACPTAHVSVSSAALDCGLVHLGRTAVRYREMFGETPSATLKAAIPDVPTCTTGASCH